MEGLRLHVEDNQGADKDVFYCHYNNCVEGVLLIFQGSYDQAGALGVADDSKEAESPQNPEYPVQMETSDIEETRDNRDQVDYSHPLKGVAQNGFSPGFFELDVSGQPSKYVIDYKDYGRNQVDPDQPGTVMLDHDG